MKFNTLNSSYEVDTANKRVRRLCGVNDPTPSQGKDGEWRAYESCWNIEVGHCANFVWYGFKGISTSVITAIFPDVEL
jgi:hypothetical protein